MRLKVYEMTCIKTVSNNEENRLNKAINVNREYFEYD